MRTRLRGGEIEKARGAPFPSWNPSLFFFLLLVGMVVFSAVLVLEGDFNFELKTKQHLGWGKSQIMNHPICFTTLLYSSYWYQAPGTYHMRGMMIYITHPWTNFLWSISPEMEQCRCRKGRLWKHLAESFTTTHRSGLAPSWLSSNRNRAWITAPGGGWSLSCPQSYDHKSSHPYHAGTEHVEFSPTRQALLAPSAKRPWGVGRVVWRVSCTLLRRSPCEADFLAYMCVDEWHRQMHWFAFRSSGGGVIFTHRRIRVSHIYMVRHISNRFIRPASYIIFSRTDDRWCACTCASASTRTPASDFLVYEVYLVRYHNTAASRSREFSSSNYFFNKIINKSIYIYIIYIYIPG